MTRCSLVLALLLALPGCRPSATQVTPDPARASAADSAPPAPSAAAQRRDPPPEPAPTDLASAAPTPADPPSASSATATGACVIRVKTVLDAQIFRGPGVDSPMRQKAMANLSPEERDRWHGRDHAYSHLQCRYAVTMNGRAYTYKHNGGQAIGFGHKLDTKTCSQPEHIRKVEEQLTQTTRQCTDPHHGAYWGNDLVEVGP